MTIYIPDNLDESSFPKDCVREHEQKHLDDLPKDSGCKKDEKGCCREAGMSPDPDDFGGKDKLKESECAAHLVTAKCCTRKAGLIGGNLDTTDFDRYRESILRQHPDLFGLTNFWNKLSRPVKIDYHAMLKDCKQGGDGWMYVDQYYPDKRSRASFPHVMETEEKYFPDFQVLSGKCYRKKKGENNNEW